MEWHITRQHTLLGLILNYTGLSIITEVASSLNRVTDCINKRPLVPFFLGCGGRGGGSGGVFPQSILEFQSPKMPFPVFQGLNWEQKSVFHSRKYSFHSGFIATQSILTSNQQMSIFKIKYICTQTNSG